MKSRIDVHGSIGVLRLMLAILHLEMSGVAFLRPHMVGLVADYHYFGSIATTTTWGVVMLIVGVGLLLLPRAGPLLILWQALSAIVFSLFTVLISSAVGLIWATAVYGTLALASGGVAYLTADLWFKRTQYPQKFRAWLNRPRK